MQSIAENGSDPVLEGRYRIAVASSSQRETVLKALAENQDDRGEVWTTDAYRAALDAGVDNSSQYVGQLVTSEFGAEIERVRERYDRFKDSLFAAYVKARPNARAGERHLKLDVSGSRRAAHGGYAAVVAVGQFLQRGTLRAAFGGLFPLRRGE